MVMVVAAAPVDMPLLGMPLLGMLVPGVVVPAMVVPVPGIRVPGMPVPGMSVLTRPSLGPRVPGVIVCRLAKREAAVASGVGHAIAIARSRLIPAGPGTNLSRGMAQAWVAHRFVITA